jgi:hypothetical protein
MSCSITIMTLACPIRPRYEAVFFEDHRLRIHQIIKLRLSPGNFM